MNSEPCERTGHYWKPTVETPMGTEYVCAFCAITTSCSTEVHAYPERQLLVQKAPVGGWIVLRDRPIGEYP